jgi:thiol-disulfide isomerase/thioredoxin
MRWLPPFAFILTGLLLASCNLVQQVRSPPHNQPLAGGIPVGQTAPDIVGEDLDGVRFKLSDYRGKVVVVVFWGTWCPPCRAMLPHERALVARLEGKPFVLLGVNSNANRETVKQYANANNLTWRMWWDGRDPGPIVQQYQVHSWPAIYVLDDQGVIRYRDVRGDDLDQAVDTLLREMANRR